jgi:hypothetical protein
MNGFPSAIGELSVAQRKKVEAYALGRKQADEIWFHADALMSNSLVGALIATPAASLLMLALPLSMGAFPPAALIPMAIAGLSIAASIGGGIAGKLSAARSERLGERAKHFAEGGDAQSFDAKLKTDGASFLQRWQSRRDAKIAERDVLKNKMRGHTL